MDKFVIAVCRGWDGDAIFSMALIIWRFRVKFRQRLVEFDSSLHVNVVGVMVSVVTCWFSWEALDKLVTT